MNFEVTIPVRVPKITINHLLNYIREVEGGVPDLKQLDSVHKDNMDMITLGVADRILYIPVRYVENCRWDVIARGVALLTGSQKEYDKLSAFDNVYDANNWFKQKGE